MHLLHLRALPHPDLLVISSSDDESGILWHAGGTQGLRRTFTAMAVDRFWIEVGKLKAEYSQKSPT